MSLVELFLAGPLCLAVYLAYYTGSSYRRPLEIVTAVCQLYGAIAFAGSEVLNVPFNLTWTAMKVRMNLTLPVTVSTSW